jgi:hypothetical protein
VTLVFVTGVKGWDLVVGPKVLYNELVSGNLVLFKGQQVRGPRSDV